MVTKYPIYVLSKGRYNACLTANFLIKDGVEFYLVVEKSEYNLYRKKYPDTNILVLPDYASGKGAIHVRNWIWSHSISNNHERHWEFDDNIRCIKRLQKGMRIVCNSSIAIKVVEDFTDRYTNIGISGFNYSMFVVNETNIAYFTNCHVYSGMLIYNNMPYRWRLNYNADTDLCLQVLDDNLCTVSFNQFSIDKIATMKMKGGNTDKYKGDGRLKMAKLLEFTWPKYVTTTWKFNRPQHSVPWKKLFKQKLIRRTDIDWDAIQKTKHNIQLVAVKDIKTKNMQQFYKNNS